MFVWLQLTTEQRGAVEAAQWVATEPQVDSFADADKPWLVAEGFGQRPGTYLATKRDTRAEMRKFLAHVPARTMYDKTHRGYRAQAAR